MLHMEKQMCLQRLPAGDWQSSALIAKEKGLSVQSLHPDVGEAFASAIAAGLSGAVTATNATGQKISG
jgi:hypothetical protein